MLSNRYRKILIFGIFILFFGAIVGNIATVSNQWEKEGSYCIKAKPMDIWDDSSLSNCFELKIGNQPPDPPIISGPPRGKINVRYNYTMSTSDPENEDVYYYINWGDGKNSGWIGPYNSGEIAKVSYIWDKKGNYQIKVKARDINLFESDWSDPLVVSMPKAKQSINLFQQLFRIFIGFLMDPAI